MSWILERLKEPTTWKGIVVMLSLIGIRLSPEATQSIVELGVALVGLILVFQKERTSKIESALPPIHFVARSDPAASGVRDDAVSPVRPSEADSESRNGSGWNG